MLKQRACHKKKQYQISLILLTQLKNIISYYQKTDDLQKKERSAMLIDDCLMKLSNTAKGFSNFLDLQLLSNAEMKELKIKTLFEETKAILVFSSITSIVVSLELLFVFLSEESWVTLTFICFFPTPSALMSVLIFFKLEVLLNDNLSL